MIDTILKSAIGRIVRRGNLEIVTSRGTRLRFGDGTGTTVIAAFTDRMAQVALLLDPDLRLGELIMDERLKIEAGSIYDLVHLFTDNLGHTQPPLLLRLFDRMRFATRRLRQRNRRARSRRNVAHHYDLDSRLYRLFLDPDMQYSCAYFEHEGQSLADAQAAKKRNICAKLGVGPGHCVLDIGCGWGGMALYAAQVCGAANVTGVTLSEEQLSVARDRARAAGLDGRVEFALQDYRDLSSRHDRIVSVGMFEHVGIAFYDSYFSTCARLLADDGVMLMHTIGSSDVPGFVTPWLDKYIFPGGYLPSLSEIMPAIERAGLIVTDVEVLQMHYATTLRHWRNTFLERRDEAAALFDERFCRMWEFYLAAAEAAFRSEGLVVFQIVLTTAPTTRPPTRREAVARADALLTSEAALSVS